MAETAYIVINCDTDRHNEILSEMRQKFSSSIKELMSVYGVYDIIAEVYSENTGTIGDVVTDIRKMRGVRSTMSLIVIKNKYEDHPM